MLPLLVCAVSLLGNCEAQLPFAAYWLPRLQMEAIERRVRFLEHVEICNSSVNNQVPGAGEELVDRGLIEPLNAVQVMIPLASGRQIPVGNLFRKPLEMMIVGLHVEKERVLGLNFEGGRLAAVFESEEPSNWLPRQQRLDLDSFGQDVRPQLAPTSLPLLKESQEDQERAGERQKNSRPSRLSSIARSVDRAPLRAKITASLILAIRAPFILFRTYIADGLSSCSRALLYLSSLTLFAAGAWLWLLSASQ